MDHSNISDTPRRRKLHPARPKVTREGAIRLTDLDPEDVRRLSPADRQEWARQSAEEQTDFAYMMDFVEDLYPHCRHYHKASRENLLIDHTGGDLDTVPDSDTPLYAAWSRLLELVDTFREDPAFLARFRHQLARCRRLPASVDPEERAPAPGTSAPLTFPRGRIESSDPAEVIRHEAWGPSDPDCEHEPLMCVKPLQDALWEFVEVAFRRNIGDPQVTGPEIAFNAELEKAAVAQITEALALAGVTDTATVNEIARRVIRGA